MNAVIVAAGKSSRLYPRTLEYPKSLLPVGDLSLIENSIKNLRAVGVEKIYVVVGFQHQKLREKLQDQVTFISNPFFEHCNNMGSLWFAKNFISGPFFYLHADIFYHKDTLQSCLDLDKESSAEMILAVDFNAKLDNETMNVRCSKERQYIESSKEIPSQDAHGEWTGIALVKSPENLFQEIEKHLLDLSLSDYDTKLFNSQAQSGANFLCSSVESDWMEIDFEEDYLEALKRFGDASPNS